MTVISSYCFDSELDSDLFCKLFPSKLENRSRVSNEA